MKISISGKAGVFLFNSSEPSNFVMELDEKETAIIVSKNKTIYITSTTEGFSIQEVNRPQKS